MRRIRSLVLSSFYFVSVVWFMYVSVELLADRSTSLAAMEMAYRLHQEQHHPKNQLHLNALPAGPEDMSNLKNVQALFAVRRDAEPQQEQRGRSGGDGVKEGDSAVKMEVAEVARQDGQDAGQEVEEPVQFPRYVEEWGPDFPGELVYYLLGVRICICLGWYMGFCSPG